MKKPKCDDRLSSNRLSEMIDVVVEARRDQVLFGPTANLVFPTEEFEVEERHADV